MKARFFDPRYLISITGFFATFKLARDTNTIHGRAAVWVLPHYVNKTLANALNNRICAEGRHSLFVASVPNEEARSRKQLRSYTEVVNYLVNKHETDESIAIHDTAILRYIKQSNMNIQKYADDLIPKSGRGANE